MAVRATAQSSVIKYADNWQELCGSGSRQPRAETIDTDEYRYLLAMAKMARMDLILSI